MTDRAGPRARVAVLSTALLLACSGLAIGAGQYERVQLWETEAIQTGWRVDRQIRTGQCRLVDPQGRDVLRGVGEQCLAALSQEAAASTDGRHLVVLLHGLGRSAASFHDMARALRAAGLTAVAVSYPSLQRPIGDHADHLAALIDAADGVARVSFVTHSMGALVVRELLARERPWASPVALGRVVMIAPPNQGSALARRLARWPVFGWVAGPSGLAIADGSAAALPAPSAEFGVIAGRSRVAGGFNPWLEGADDGVVRVAETRLQGAEDSLAVEAVHTFIMADPAVVEATLRFIAEGRFAPRSNL